MPEENAESLFAITELYASEARRGQQPRLSDYLARYPHYAAEISDFAAYYHAYETSGLVYHTSAQTATAHERPVCFITATGEQLSLAQIATQLNLSPDILSLVAQQAIPPATIPQTLYLKLAALLQLPVDVVQSGFLSPAPTHRSQRRVAEGSGHYSPSGTGERPDFLTLVGESTDLTPHQKAYWQRIAQAEQDGLDGEL